MESHTRKGAKVPTNNGMRVLKLNGQPVTIKINSLNELSRVLKDVNLDSTPTTMFLTRDGHIGKSGQVVHVCGSAKFPYSETVMAIALVQIGEAEEAETVVGIIPQDFLSATQPLQTQATPAVSPVMSLQPGLSSA